MRIGKHSGVRRIYGQIFSGNAGQAAFNIKKFMSERLVLSDDESRETPDGQRPAD